MKAKSKVKPKRGFTIDRRIWYRGEDGGSYLYRSEDRKQCCVGIYLRACGVAVKDVRDQTTAARMVEEGGVIPSRAGWLNDLSGEWPASSTAASMLYAINDAAKEAGREQRLASIFARHGETVRFIGPKRKAAPKR